MEVNTTNNMNNYEHLPDDNEDDERNNLCLAI